MSETSAVPVAPGSAYIRVVQAERLEKRDRGGVIAEIALGHHEGQWVFATGFQQRGGDCWGSGGPLGLLPGRTTTFATRDEALAGAIAHLRHRWAGREKWLAEQLAWLDTLNPAQLDLFGAAP